MSGYEAVERWHRELCLVTDQMTISGDLHPDPRRATAQIAGWQRTGITHVLDTRHEWSDESLVAETAPEIVYGWIGTDDDGRRQPDDWFDAGVAFATDAFSSEDSMVLVHCHMGINRGPSMAYRILLELGWDPIDALAEIRSARPIADIAYATDALDHFHNRHEIAEPERALDRDRLNAWQRGYPTTGLTLTRPD